MVQPPSLSAAIQLSPLVQKQEFVSLPKLPIPWHWAMLPFSLAQDEKGRPSFWVKARNKGIVKDRERPSKDRRDG